jgi:glucose-1-phosphate thymidylyltransferase
VEQCNCLILAGGFGTRLKELGETVPKGLIPTKGGTLLDQIIKEVALSKEISKVALISNGRFIGKFAQWFKDNYQDLPITLFDNGTILPENRLGAIGDMIFALDRLKWQEDLLIVPSDTWFNFSLSNFINFAQTHDGISTVVREVASETEIANRLGCAVLAGDSMVGFVEKPAHPPSPYAAVPFYYYKKAYVSLLKVYKEAGNNLDAPGSIFPWLLTKEVSVFAWKVNTLTVDVGTLEEVQKIQEL